LSLPVDESAGRLRSAPAHGPRAITAAQTTNPTDDAEQGCPSVASGLQMPWRRAGEQASEASEEMPPARRGRRSGR
jgi:hypothetical protein